MSAGRAGAPASRWSFPIFNDPDLLSAQLASAVLAAAPYAALRTSKPHLDAAALRRCLADPALAARHPLSQILLGISGNAQDAATLEARLRLRAGQSGDRRRTSAPYWPRTWNCAARSAWRGSNRPISPTAKRTAPEIKAALLALSVHGTANTTIPRERVIAAYRIFMKAHPEIAGNVAPDLAAWQYWDAVPDYLALIRSRVPQQYPSRLAILAYLQQNPNATTADTAAAVAPAADNAALGNPALSQP